MKKFVSILFVLLLITSIVPLALGARLADGGSLPDYVPVYENDPRAGEVPMPEIEPIENFELSEIVDVESFHSTPPVGTWVWDWYLSARADAYGYGSPYMQLRAVVGNAEVWVAEDPSLMYPTGDPRNDNPKNWQVTDEMAQYIAEEFADNIYPTDTFYFGAPDDRDGTGTIFQDMGWPSWTYDWIETYPYNPQRVIIKIFNIVDDGFFDPTYPYYVVGFYSSTYTGYYNRNMIHIDNWKYCERLGPEGYNWYPDTEVVRPYVYEATVAHEFQHNIHHDWQPESELWMNEGCSMYAELVCGYGIDYDYFNYYFATPDNSLTIWGDQGDINIIADYGVVALWTTYLSDHYGGGDTIRAYVQSGITGIEGIDYALMDQGYTETFEDVYHDWRIANLIRSDTPGSGKYNYESIDLNAPEIIPVRAYEVEARKGHVKPTRGTDFGTTWVWGDEYNTGIAEIGPYGSDYIKIENLEEGDTVLWFDGEDTTGWTMTKKGWYSDAADLLNTLLYGEAYVDPADPTLVITTYWDIEDYWDFGFVQVSTDGGETWTSLENDYTISYHDPDAHPDIIDNLPGLTSWSKFITGNGWITMEFDLTGYAEETVLIGFRYMTDWAFTYEGWYISEASASGTTLELSPVCPEIDFQVTMIGWERDAYVFVEDMTLDDLTETDVKYPSVDEDEGYVLLIVSPMVSAGFSDYMFEVTVED